MSDGAVWLRLLAAFGALALGGAAAVIVAVLAHRTPGPAGATNTPKPVVAPAKPSFPAPPPGAVVFSRPDGSDVLALAVVPGRRLGLQASVVDGQGAGISGLNVSFRVGSRAADGRPCGAGCYGATVPSAGAPKLVEVRVSRDRKTTSWRVPLPQPWPPPDATELVARTTKAFRSVKTFAVRDWLDSGPQTPTLFTRWTIVAPDRLTYQVKNGPAAVIIGNHRWDKLPGRKWEVSQQTPIHQPAPFWVSWTDARILDESKSSWRVSFFDPKTPGWYELRIDKRSLRPIELRMHATAHFMREVYDSFNAPLKITPP